MGGFKEAKIYNEAELTSDVFYLVCAGNGKFVRVFTGNNSALHALGDHADQYCLFQFVRADNGTVKLFSLYHRDFVSAIGADWPLFPRVEDETWSRFKLMVNNNGTINLQSAQPIAKSAFVSVIGESRILRIAEATPRQPWSYFIPYSARAHIEDIDNFIGKQQYTEKTVRQPETFPSQLT